MKAQSGSVLIMVLVFSTLIALVANTGIESGILQLKMVNNFKSFLNIKSQAESELISIEKMLASDFHFTLPSNVKFLQFVPDTLHFGENQGSNYYRIDISRSNDDGSNMYLNSTFGVRKKEIDVQDSAIILPNGDRTLIVLESKTCTNKSRLIFLDYEYGHKIKEFIIPTITSEFVAVDSKGSGFSDIVYFGDDEGNLWKINLHNWVCQQYPLRLSGSIIAKPIVGRHPSENGVLIYLLTRIKLNKQQVIHVFHDNYQQIKPFYTIEEEPSLGPPLMRQGYLLCVDKFNNLNIYDVFTGASIKKEKMIYFNEGGPSVGDNELPQVTIDKPLDRIALVTVNTSNGMFFCRTEIEFGRLGRRTWKTRNY